MKYQLAQINIAQAQDTMQSEVMQGFVDRLDEINALADTAPGFVWRLQSDEGDATAIRAFDDPNLLINMSVWEDIESLKTFVYRSSHIELIQDRNVWFHKMLNVYQALWWIHAGHTPSPEEGKQRLDHLQQHEPDKTAFTFAKPHGPPIEV